MGTEQKIVHGRGPHNKNLGIFVIIPLFGVANWKVNLDNSARRKEPILKCNHKITISSAVMD